MFRKYVVEATPYFLKDRFTEKRGFRLAYAAAARGAPQRRQDPDCVRVFFSR
jgi:hypothetical protein